MHRYLLFILMLVVSFSMPIFGDDYLKKDILIQLYTEQDPAILDIDRYKYYVNPERVHITCEGMFLDTDSLGLLPLFSLKRDVGGTYTVGLYDYYRCTGCSTCYDYQPAVCGVCGSTTFNRIDNLDD